MRICIHKPTRRIIEMQSAGKEGTLLQNALNAGYALPELEETEVTPTEYAAKKEEDPDGIARLERQAANEAAQAAKIIAISDAKAAIASLVPAVDKATDIEGLKKVVLDLIKNVQAITA